ncbi:MAG: hypothetical protein KKB82_09500 [Candidatus Omnitrophica bacterium]|nr:hypothetical protein [Candidatus Omnitrophota bacterium]
MEQFRKLRGHLFIFTAFFIYYLIFKIMFRQEYDYLRLSLWGGHIIKKVVYYLGLIPLVISPLLYHKHFIVAAYIVLCVIFFAKKRMLADKTFLDKYYIGFWVSWLVIGMIPPCALLTNVIAEYYFTYSLCPLIVLLLIFIKLFFTQLSAKEAVFKIIVFLLISTSFISGTLSLRKGNEKGIFSTVETRGAYLAKIIHENMLKIYPVLPKDVFIVLPKEIYRCLGAEDNALRLWYNNPHLDTGILRVEDYNVCSQHDKIPIVVTNLNTYASRHNLPQRKKYLLNYNKGIIALARIDIDPNDVVLDAYYDDIF